MTITQQVLEDEQAVSLAVAVAAANAVAREAGVYDRDVTLEVEQAKTDDGIALWRIHYLPVPPPDVFIRGGDYIVEVLRDRGTVHRVMRGQ